MHHKSNHFLSSSNEKRDLLITGRAQSNTMAYNNSQALRFAADGTFKISIFQDLHYGEC